MKRIIILLAVALLSVALVSADGVDDQGNPNDPNVNDRANACFEGGDMEGKCDTPWEWVCGWHVIRLDPQDEDSRVEFPQECISLLPPLIQPIIQAAAPSGVCIISNGAISRYWPGGTGPSPSQFYGTNTTCSGVPWGTDTYVAAVNLAAAQALCASASATGWTHSPPLWWCH